MNSLVSVIIPVYNVEEYLPKCLDSVTNQTYRNLEIILVDDGSPDRCGAICDAYARQDSRIRVIHQKNGGLSAARNAGLDTAKGECVMFVDSDDWISADAVQILHDRIKRDGSDLVIGGMRKVWADGSVETDADPKGKDMVLSREQCLKMLGRNWILPCYACGKLFRRSIFEMLRFPSVTRAEDVWILPHVLENCRTVSLAPDVVYSYYQRETSIVHTSGDREHLDSMRASLHVARFLYDRGLPVGAGGYYYAARKEGRLVRNQKQAEGVLDGVFTGKERRHMLSCCYVHWRFFLPENLYQSLRRAKRSAKTILTRKSTPHK